MFFGLSTAGTLGSYIEGAVLSVFFGLSTAGTLGSYIERAILSMFFGFCAAGAYGRYIEGTALGMFFGLSTAGTLGDYIEGAALGVFFSLGTAAAFPLRSLLGLVLFRGLGFLGGFGLPGLGRVAVIRMAVLRLGTGQRGLLGVAAFTVGMGLPFFLGAGLDGSGGIAAFAVAVRFLAADGQSVCGDRTGEIGQQKHKAHHQSQDALRTLTVGGIFHCSHAPFAQIPHVGLIFFQIYHTTLFYKNQHLTGNSPIFTSAYPFDIPAVLLRRQNSKNPYLPA